MPDITMCLGYEKDIDKHCPMKESCYRYMARPSEYRQSYFVDAPFLVEPDGFSCEYFWKVENENK